jgi:hypothetical protein
MTSPPSRQHNEAATGASIRFMRGGNFSTICCLLSAATDMDKLPVFVNVMKEAEK